jgi:hypothetical protein
MLVSAYANGATAGSPPPPRDHSNDAPRGKITGWSADASRRNTRFLYSVETPALTGYGVALTLTLRDLPPTAAHWVALRKRWLQRLRRAGALSVHWVVEWQRRGHPHLHVAIYWPEGTRTTDALGMPVLWWLQIADEYRAEWQAQDGKPIDGALGWLQYVSKHAARGAAHYQRSGHPPGWDEGTGRLWGRFGAWPTGDPLRFDMGGPAYWRFRRLVRSWRIAQARSAGVPSRIRYARRMLRCTDPRLSAVRGVSDWLSESIALEFVGLLWSEGFEISQRFADENEEGQPPAA